MVSLSHIFEISEDLLNRLRNKHLSIYATAIRDRNNADAYGHDDQLNKELSKASWNYQRAGTLGLKKQHPENKDMYNDRLKNLKSNTLKFQLKNERNRV
jgi:hypothetical protein